MAILQRWSPLSAAWNRALAISLAVTILYSLVVFGYSLLPSWNVSISGTLWHALCVIDSVRVRDDRGSCPAWLRYKIRSPGAADGHSPFWHVLAYIPRLEVAKVIRPDSSSCSSGHQYISSAMPSQPAVSTGFGIATPQCFPRPYRHRRKNHNREPFSFVAGSLCSHESFAQYDPIRVSDPA